MAIVYASSSGSATGGLEELDLGVTGTFVVATDQTKPPATRSYKATGTTAAGAWSGQSNILGLVRRMSIWMRLDATPTSGSYRLFNIVNASGAEVFGIRRLTSGRIGVSVTGNTAAVAGTVDPSLNTWFEFVIAWTITSRNVNAFAMWIDDVANGSGSNIQLSPATDTAPNYTPQDLRFGVYDSLGGSGLTLNAWYAHLVIDDTDSRTNTPDYLVAHKRPFATGVAGNNFGTLGSSSGYGSGNAVFVNAVPISLSNARQITGNSATSTGETYTVEDRATGADASDKQVVATVHWTYAVGLGTDTLIANGSAAVPAAGVEGGAFAATVSKVRRKIVQVSDGAYPSGTNAIGMARPTGGNQDLIMYEAGILNVLAYNQLLNGLDEYWKMEEASGSRVGFHAQTVLADNATVTSTTGKLGTNAGQFTSANSEYLNKTGTAFQYGDSDFTIAAWVKLDAVAGERTIVSRWDTSGAHREYNLRYSESFGGSFQFLVSADGTNPVGVTSDIGTPTAGQWYHVVAWHDSVNNQIGISVNGTVTTASHSTGVFQDATAEFRVGAAGFSGNYWNGAIDAVGLWARVLTTQERNALYFGGAGQEYPWTDLDQWIVVPLNIGIASAQAFGTPTVTQPGAGSTQTLTNVGGIASAEAFGSPSVSKKVAPSGITTGEAFGTATIKLKIVPGGIASAEAFGTVSLKKIVSPAGIPSAQAFGTATIKSIVAPAGIASAEAFGTPSLRLKIVPAGIASAEAFGTFRTTLKALVASIVSEEVFGTPSLLQITHVTLTTGIASAEALGTPAVSKKVAPTGIATGESFGTATVRGIRNVVPGGIDSTEVFGSPTVTPQAVQIVPGGIASAGAFGTPTVTPQAVHVTVTAGVASAEALGTPTVVRGAVTIAPSGIASLEALGSPTVVPGSAYITPSGVPTAEAFGTPTLRPTVTVSPAGIATAGAIGTPTVVPGAAFIVPPGGIPSAESFGVPLVATDAVAIYPTGTPSAEAFGAPTVAAGFVVVSPAGIPSAEAFGAARIKSIVAPSGVASAEAFGTAQVKGTVHITVSGIASAGAVGTPTVVPQAVSITPGEIPSLEAFGSAVVASGQAFVVPSGIPSAGAFGTPTVSVGSAPSQTITVGSGIPSGETFGTPSVKKIIAVESIGREDVVGTPTLSTRTTVTGGGIPSGETFGTPRIVLFVVTLGVPSQEALGTPSLKAGIGPNGIPSGELFGTPSFSTGAVVITMTGIPSAGVFGFPIIARGRNLESPVYVTLTPAGRRALALDTRRRTMELSDVG